VAKIRITQIRSGIGNSWDMKATLKSLGFRRMNQSVIQEDCGSVRGMITKIRHLVKVEVVK
jgi:large subunit ribosomal protein L30